MKDYFLIHKSELLKTVIIIIVFLAIRLIINKTVRKVGKNNTYKKARIKLILRYVNIIILFISSLIISLIWSLDFRKLGLFFSSIFAILGIALFAQWSVLSNITSGVVLFFYFPFKIGDKIRIQDKDFTFEAVIEDIKAFNVNLRNDKGELITYPNSLFLQKGVLLLNKKNNNDHIELDDFSQE